MCGRKFVCKGVSNAVIDEKRERIVVLARQFGTGSLPHKLCSLYVYDFNAVHLFSINLPVRRRGCHFLAVDAEQSIVYLGCNQVLAVSVEERRLLRKMGPPDNVVYLWNQEMLHWLPHGLCVHAKTQDLYVCDVAHNCVHVFDKTGAFVSLICHHSDIRRTLLAPMYVAVDYQTNRICVASRFGTIGVYNHEGILERKYFDLPCLPTTSIRGMVVHPVTGNILVLDKDNGQLVILRLDGSHVRTLEFMKSRDKRFREGSLGCRPAASCNNRWGNASSLAIHAYSGHIVTTNPEHDCVCVSTFT